MSKALLPQLTSDLGIIELDSDSDNDLDERSLDEYKLRLNINGREYPSVEVTEPT